MLARWTFFHSKQEGILCVVNITDKKFKNMLESATKIKTYSNSARVKKDFDYCMCFLLIKLLTIIISSAPLEGEGENDVTC